MEEVIKKAKLVLKEGKINQISERMWEITNDLDPMVVTEITKPGRTFLTCACSNDSRFPTQNVLCYHKIAVILFAGNKKLYSTITKCHDHVENTIKLNLPLEPKVIQQFLEDIRGLG